MTYEPYTNSLPFWIKLQLLFIPMCTKYTTQSLYETVWKYEEYKVLNGTKYIYHYNGGVL